MSERHGWISIFLAIAGLGACVVAIVGFFWTIVTNGLPFHPLLSAREHYQAVGNAYSSGFLTGFFLCFFLVLAVSGVVAILGPRRARLRGRGWARHLVSFPKRSA